ncbi:PREDICTED: MLO [Prunus dulcis]|uniref:MLO-like protein n=1 Tax=Prunus dulcis TaxID=3755 RepID=A0A5E4FDV5_PRUDU|nr:MLO-like protein 1 isoform X1 [Prunus dulcis]VVA26037.1 PREDICTED: MLO [Prunus dulcis]
MAEGETTLEYTPTWVVAAVCSVVVLISLAVERVLHYTDKYLKKKTQKPVFEALQKIKQELLLGLIALLLTTFQDRLGKICITETQASQWLPCKKQDTSTSTTAPRYCSEGKVPLLSAIAWHHLHIFIFVLAAVHATFCVLTILFAKAKMSQWKRWEDSIKSDYHPEEVLKMKIIAVHDHDFIRSRVLGFGRKSDFIGWLFAFLKQFYGSVSKEDYLTMRHGFVQTHCRGNPKFNFHKYMIRALAADFKSVVGISWYLWIFVVIFLLLNVWGWHSYFWIAFIPLILLLAVGTKLEHVITQLANEVAEKHIAIEGDLVVQPSDYQFWFHRPRLILFLIHIILFQNSFQLAYFFWLWYQYSFDSCIMGKVAYIIPRLIIGAFIQFVCSYSTFPLYAIVTQMGSSFKKAIFEEHIQEGLIGWARSAKRNKPLRRADPKEACVTVNESSVEVGTTGEIELEPPLRSPK